MTPTILMERRMPEPVEDVTLDQTLAAHVGALRQYIVGVLAREGCALDARTLDDVSETVLAEAVRLAVHWVERESPLER